MYPNLPNLFNPNLLSVLMSLILIHQYTNLSNPNLYVYPNLSNPNLSSRNNVIINDTQEAQ